MKSASSYSHGLTSSYPAKTSKTGLSERVRLSLLDRPSNLRERCTEGAKPLKVKAFELLQAPDYTKRIGLTKQQLEQIAKSNSMLFEEVMQEDVVRQK